MALLEKYFSKALPMMEKVGKFLYVTPFVKSGTSQEGKMSELTLPLR